MTRRSLKKKGKILVNIIIALKKMSLFIKVSLLFAYIGIGMFGLFAFSHTIEMPMIDCPYADGAFSVCDNNLDHINSWQQFSKAIVPPSLVLLLLILFVVLYFISTYDVSNQEQYVSKYKHYLYNKRLYNPLQEIIKWLSLFENSPSLSYKT